MNWAAPTGCLTGTVEMSKLRREQKLGAVATALLLLAGAGVLVLGPKAAPDQQTSVTVLLGCALLAAGVVLAAGMIWGHARRRAKLRESMRYACPSCGLGPPPAGGTDEQTFVCPPLRPDGHAHSAVAPAKSRNRGVSRGRGLRPARLARASHGRRGRGRGLRLGARACHRPSPRLCRGI